MDKNVFLKIVKESIEEELYGKKLDKNLYLSLYPELKTKRATFVTINKRGSLRGCIGSLVPYQSLFEDLVKNAKSAAFGDPRFPPLSREEYESGELEIEISLLSIPKPLEYKDTDDLKSKITKKHGVILSLNGHRATFLPQVWEQIESFEEFFAHLCLKAGLEVNCLKNHPDIEIYEVEKIK